MDSHIRNHFKEIAERLSSIKGVGTMTVSRNTMVGGDSGNGERSPARISALIGVSILSTGTLRDYAWPANHFWRQAGVRSALYMAALVATRFNPVIKTFYVASGRVQPERPKSGAGSLYA
ncbi:IS110 family transposase (plasmid) [Klebsiella pneumoniae]|nr:IS110 family transposase [Klebsiella pneumoniae]